ncbi:MAG: MBL fold metallo-hydrolase [Azoarcus sp.]|nr:MAG: MBL fold metallo-hydrolase [Azoarcus sp.]
MIANGVPVIFRPVEGHATGQIGYVLGDSADGVAVVIDPPAGETELILALLTESGLRLVMVLRTHVHANDTGNCAALCERTGAVLVSGETARNGSDAVRRAVHGDVLTFGGQVIRVLATPGHTSNCVSYLWHDRLMCGDTFDLGSCSAENSESNPAELYDSLTRHIFPLPDQVLVFPAHAMKARRVAMLAELRARLTPVLARGRDAFITEMASRQRSGSAGSGSSRAY